MTIKARVVVTLKRGVLDPQGKAIESALRHLGFSGIGAVRQGKVFDLVLEETDPQRARKTLEDMAKKLLTNAVMEDFSIEIVET